VYALELCYKSKDITDRDEQQKQQAVPQSAHLSRQFKRHESSLMTWSGKAVPSGFYHLSEHKAHKMFEKNPKNTL